MRGKEITVYQVDFNVARGYRDWRKITEWLSTSATGSYKQVRSSEYVVTFEFETLSLARKFVEEFEEHLDVV